MDPRLSARLALQRAKEDGVVNPSVDTTSFASSVSRVSVPQSPADSRTSGTPTPCGGGGGGQSRTPGQPARPLPPPSGKEAPMNGVGSAAEAKISSKLQALMNPDLLAKEVAATTPEKKEPKMNANLQAMLAPELLARETASINPQIQRHEPKMRETQSAPVEKKMDPKLRERMEQQLAKEESGASDMADVSTAYKLEKKFDPKLQKRIDEQLAKEAEGSSMMTDISSASKIEKKFEPVLERRMKAQLDKEAGLAEALPQNLERTDKIETKLDPKLQKRMEKQQQKLVTGESEVEDYRMKDNKIACQSDLEKRMARQREKVITGQSDVGAVGSVANGTLKASSELAAKFEHRRKIDEEIERKAAGLDDELLNGRRPGPLRRLGRAIRSLFCGSGTREQR